MPPIQCCFYRDCRVINFIRPPLSAIVNVQIYFPQALPDLVSNEGLTEYKTPKRHKKTYK